MCTRSNAGRMRGAPFTWSTCGKRASGRGHLPGATYLGRGVIERDIETRYPDPDTELYLYCGGGFRSILVAENLQKMGYGRVVSVDGGFRGWCDAGYPVES